MKIKFEESEYRYNTKNAYLSTWKLAFNEKYNDYEQKALNEFFHNFSRSAYREKIITMRNITREINDYLEEKLL